MWILPKNHPLASAFVTESEDSTRDLNELSELYEHCALWRSKQWRAQTWSQRWKRVKWLRALYGRTLRLGQHISFETELIGSLVDIRAHRFHLQDSGKEKMILDTFGRILNDTSKQFDLFSSDSKTLMITLHSDSRKFMQAYNGWVMQLRQEYSQRKKLARHTRDNASSSWPSEETIWPTPNSSADGRIPKEDWTWHGSYWKKPDGTKVQTQLNHDKRIQNWKTPGASESEGGALPELTGDAKFKLRDQVNWITPRSAQINETYETYISRMKASKDPKNNTKTNPGSLEQQVNWPTPSTVMNAQDEEKFYERQKRLKARNPTSGNGAGPSLGTAVNFWPTPTFAGNNNGSLQEWGGKNNKFRPTPPHKQKVKVNCDCGHSWISTEDKYEKEVCPSCKTIRSGTVTYLYKKSNFATPNARDYKDGRASEETMNKNSRNLNEQIVSGPQGLGDLNTGGSTHELSRGRLNPMWVSQLMDFRFEKTFFVHLGTLSFQHKQNGPSQHSSDNS